eukprot:COSAG02_NODE_200_length_29507_cov_440.183487_9_plen_181_part_00
MITGATLALLAEDASTCGQNNKSFVVFNCHSFFRPAPRSERVFLAAPCPLRRHGTTQARREARASAIHTHAKQMNGRQRMRRYRIKRSGERGAGTKGLGTDADHAHECTVRASHTFPDHLVEHRSTSRLDDRPQLRLIVWTVAVRICDIKIEQVRGLCVAEVNELHPLDRAFAARTEESV